MSKIDRTYPSASERGSERKSRTTVRQLFLRAIRQWQRSRAINELSRLDNRQLEDIGISRNHIPRVVEGLFSPEGAKPLPMADYLGESPVIVAESYIPRRA
ncbi:MULTISPECIES: DUF1127 domain-containing protein [unclassified Mesorhizobium]|jgi:uncharacterized protein YjiS (DUF1127 family)|uniref:DUF1127 domain-containing protein n=1 Tax=unclassified Mesorhizobium TaxID=325217 RepID=UPI0009FCFA85|nr:DUF1127 domain-containing protein [Mesorhizobium sp. BR1-1-3]ARP65567.1 hypothetical protein A9K65_021050 [Mesorhizobium sp. WSM1497]RUX76667.1 DUF1127 domain-containing protein [Mesorhizobium sp. M7A.F.Ca.US.005.03.1.1]RUY19431.1 DUF1127 domain-containing protein [Mesorhizobium sp. M7A.F.Ca.US.005.03.2.1]RUY26554.1 DUF1127 domain-containing protein [Mesorhizobium sp. M7A.F.Ca.US.001.04.2.1]RUY42182.1 DUF1127 domain-containing protein [Mesorhizobium sp. M7A.F.Ca.US.001.04.1.1]RUY98206.1 DU